MYMLDHLPTGYGHLPTWYGGKKLQANLEERNSL